MLSLHDVSKTYVTKSKVETQALKDVSLDIANCGMVFILGKSGSGKSTLLNLLGGLDSPTSGEITVDGVSMTQFTRKDYDSYRNSYVGFIFQEFNLLKDFNVRDNIALALRLSKVDNIDEKVSNALKQVELNDDYLNRRIGEMSGGEKQRIAIARAIIKDSKIILADEPTGNLDSATGESIWNILKNLSKTRLVVVVSHDRESAEKYADRIIEIADGQVVADNGKQPLEAQTKETAQTTDEPKTLTTAKSRLSFATKLKMGFNNLRLRKFKTISTVVMTVLCTFAILLIQMFLSFSSEIALADFITENNVEYFTVRQGHAKSFGDISSNSTIMHCGTKKYIEDNCRSISNGRIESKQDLLDFGFTFVGETLELNDNSFYATSSVIEDAYYGIYAQGSVEINGAFETMNKESHPIEFLIGKNVRLYGHGGYAEGVLAGVIDCKPLTNSSALPGFFYNEKFTEEDDNRQIMLNGHNDNEKETLYLSDKMFDGEVIIYPASWGTPLVSNLLVLVTADGILSDGSNVKLADNEIVMPYEMYAAMFNANSKWYYVNSALDEVRNMPPEIGQTFDLKLFIGDDDELIVDYKEVKLAGIEFSKYDQSPYYTVIAGQRVYKSISNGMSSPKILVQTCSVKDIRDFAVTLRGKYDGYIDYVGSVDVTQESDGSQNDVAVFMYRTEGTLRFLSVMLAAFCVILMIILVLLVINLISLSIANRRKEIGILSAIGASNEDVTGIFLLETAIIAAIGFVFSFVLCFVSPLIFNRLMSVLFEFAVVLPLIRVDILTIATLIVSSFGLLLLATLIPLRKIIKLKPIDAIRNV